PRVSGPPPSKVRRRDGVQGPPPGAHSLRTQDQGPPGPDGDGHSRDRTHNGRPCGRTARPADGSDAAGDLGSADHAARDYGSRSATPGAAPNDGGAAATDNQHT